METGTPSYFATVPAAAERQGDFSALLKLNAFTADDWTAMMDFFDQHLLGKKSTFNRFPTGKELDEAAAAASTAPPARKQ